MLRQIRFRNFVKFNGSQEHRLDFPNNGVYIFIGENNAGKSCVFEGIRRCMQTELNDTVSARHNSDYISYVICKFENANNDMLTSCFVSYKDGSDTVIRKIVLNKSDNGNIITRSISRKIDSRWGSFKEETLSDDNNKLHKLCSQLLNVKNKDEIDLTYFIEFCKTHSSDNNLIEKFDQAFEKINFETIFANRGISPNQSSRQIPITKDQDIYKSASNLAYVIRTHLNDPKECADDGSESQYFRLLTEPQSYKFEFKDKTDKTEVLVTCNNDDKPFPILKAPEGILEAKIMSITLSNRRTTTLLIDEPGRGMHPSMIDCLRDLVLYDVNKNEAKTVIFTTHNERFICPWTFEKIFYFYACENGSKVVTLGHALEEVKRRYSVHKSKENQVDIKPYFWREQVTPIFFSKRVIMVEGPDDNRFLGAFKNILLTDEARRSSVCKGDPYIDHELRKFLTSLHIIDMGGKCSVNGIEPLCEALNLTQRKRRYYLFDSDALKNIKSSLMRTDFNKSDIEDQKLEKLEENGIFVWFAYTDIIVENFENLSDADLKRYGRLEEAIVEFSNTHDKIHHEQNKNCKLDNCMGMNTMLKNLRIDVADKRNFKKKKPFELNNINYLEMREITTRIIDISILYGDDCFYRDTNFMCPFKRLLQFLINQSKRS
ncbi:uncharacterized protein LOC143082249 [Mytilus galloprovincialis]|uniref:uncharacterized protein LOC143082249 n=1 Tax=Mytilus galloprovincialis TaxID=29158 RepID=UPI003F7BE492